MGKKTGREYLRVLAEGAVSSLRARRGVINNLNVFPVPDGDTGTNMYLTMVVAFLEMERAPLSRVDQAVDDLATGALMGSRGNSGIILSQLLEGIASGISNSPNPGVQDLLRGLEIGTDLAYSAVQDPVEGTILTVIRETFEGLRKHKNTRLSGFLAHAHDLACRSLIRTPRLLEPLARANVVDAGGAGLVAALEGALAALGKEPVEFAWEEFESRAVVPGYAGPRWGMRFMANCSKEDLETFKARISGLGESIIVAGTSPPYQVHMHTDHPEKVSSAADPGVSLSGVKIVSLAQQARGLEPAGNGERRRVCALACAPGEGLAEAFVEMGALVVNGGPGHQPGTGALLDAIESLEGELVIIIPNNSDIVTTARAAAELAKARVEVIPTHSPVQGLAALEEYMEGGDPDDVLVGMIEATRRVRSGSVTRAVRDLDQGDIKIAKGQFLGLAEEAPVCSGNDIVEVAFQVCKSLEQQRKGHIVTIVAGEGLSSKEKEAVRERIEKELPELEQEWYDGGQPYYQLILGVE